MNDNLLRSVTRDTVPLADSLTFHSDVLDETRRICVVVPETYAGGDKAYPVLVLLDGEGHLRHGPGVAEFLAVRNRIPEMIVVTVDNTDRCRDMSPSPCASDERKHKFAGAGGAAAFLECLAAEIIPLVESQYRTQPVRALCGSSFSGLFTAYCFLARPELFYAYIACTPSLWWNDAELLDVARDRLARWDAGERFIQVSIGGAEGGRHRETIEAFARLLDDEAPPAVRHAFLDVPDEGHMGAYLLSLYRGLKTAFDAWPAGKDVSERGVRGFREHFAMLSRRYGLRCNPTEFALTALSRWHLYEKHWDDAADLLTYCLELYPDSADAHAKLARALRALGRGDEADRHARRAEELDPALAAKERAMEHAVE